MKRKNNVFNIFENLTDIPNRDIVQKQNPNCHKLKMIDNPDRHTIAGRTSFVYNLRCVNGLKKRFTDTIF